MRVSFVFGAVLVAAGAAQAMTLEAKIWNEGNRGHVEVTGSAAEFPDGTEFTAQVIIKGNYDPPLMGAQFRVRVKGGQFVQKHARPAEFGPLRYTVKLNISLDRQAPALAKELRKTHGWPAGYQKELGFDDARVGTEEQSAEFRLSVLRRIRELADDLTEVVETLKPAMKRPIAKNRKWEETHALFVEQSRALGGKTRTFRREYAVLPDQDLLDTITKTLNTMSKMVDHLKAGGHPKKTETSIGQVKRWADAVRSDVVGRLPASERDKKRK